MSQHQSHPPEPTAETRADAGIARFIRASELAGDGEYDQAEEEFANAVLLSPQLLLARYQLGFLLFLRGRTAQAQLIWQPLQSPETHTAESDTLVSFVNGFAALARGDLGPAVMHFQTGLAHGSDNEPLLDDARKIIARIESAMQAEPMENAASVDETPKDAPPVETHVLLNGYLRPGTH